MRHLPRPLLLYHWFCLALLFGILCFASLTSWWWSPWQPFLFDTSAVALAVLVLLPSALRGELRLFPPVLPFALALLWGLAQIAAHWTVYAYPTERSVLRGLALFCLFWCTRVLADQLDGARLMVSLSFAFAASVTVAGGVLRELRPQLALGVFPPSRSDMNIFAGFISYHEYAEFTELFVPIAVWKAVRQGWKGWGYWLIVLLMVATTLAMGSRMGSALVILEVPAAILVALPSVQRRRAVPWLAGLAVLGMSAVSWFVLVKRGLDTGSGIYGSRLKMVTAALRMWLDHPLTGVGLGNYPIVHPAYATFDNGLFVNAAHNELMQALAEGGPVFVALLLAGGLWQLRGLRRAGWGIGMIAVGIHSLVEFPFHWSSVASWFGFLLALTRSTGSDSQKQKGPLLR